MDGELRPQSCSVAVNAKIEGDIIVIREAHIGRFPKDGTKGRPERVLEDITKNISTDFTKVCIEFWNREGIYDKVLHYR